MDTPALGDSTWIPFLTPRWQTMRHINSTMSNYIKNTNELQAVLQNDFSSFQASPCDKP